MLSSYQKHHNKFLNNSSDSFKPDSDHGEWETDLYKYFPKLEEGYVDVDEFVSEMRTVEKAYQIGCIFIILNGKNNGVYPSSVKFRCAGIRGQPCSGVFTMYRDNLLNKYFSLNRVVKHEGHDQLSKMQVEKALNRIQSRRSKLYNTLSLKRKNTEFIKLKSEIYEKDMDDQTSSPSYQNYDDDNIRRKIKVDPNKSIDGQDDMLNEGELNLENEDTQTKGKFLERTGSGNGSKKVYKSLLKYMKKENDLLLQCYETTQELYRLEQLENQKLHQKIARLKQENYILKNNGVPDNEQSLDQNQQIDQDEQQNNDDEQQNDGENDDKQNNQLQDQSNQMDNDRKNQQSSIVDEVNSY